MPNEDNLSKSEMRRRFGPFVVLGHHLSNDFKEMAADLLYLVREYGARNFSPTGKEIPTKENFHIFAQLVHDGWKQAQLIIADYLIKNLIKIKNANTQIKQCRRERKFELAKEHLATLSVLELENIVLRRIFDVIPWTIFQSEHSTIRRLQIKGGESNLSIQNIQETIPAANHFNLNPLQIAICTDITTFIHIGDLLVCDMQTGKKSFFELKSGEKNIAIAHAAAAAAESGCERFEQLTRASFNVKDAEHFDRTKRQYTRNSNAARTINEEKGFDNNSGAPVQIHSTSISVEDFSDAIVKCWHELSDKKHWSIASVEECVYIGVYDNRDMAFVGFSGWMSAMECTSKIFNITDSFRMPMVRPLGSANLPYELIVKVLRGEIQIFICLDLKRFINLGNQMFPGFLSLADKRSTRKARSDFYETLELDDQMIKTHGANTDGNMGRGIESRIVFDFQYPSNALKILHAMTQDSDASI